MSKDVLGVGCADVSVRLVLDFLRVRGKYPNVRRGMRSISVGVEKDGIWTHDSCL